MANPNKTVSNWRQSNPRPRKSNPDRINQELEEIMNRVIDGTLTSKEASKLIAALTE